MTKRNGSPNDLNEDDEYRIKRQRNNLAVKKCRNLSKEMARETKDRVEILKTENERLRGQIDELQKTVQFLEKLISEKNPRKDEDTVSYIIEDASENREKFNNSDSTCVIFAEVNVKSEMEDQDDSSIIPSDRAWDTYLCSASPYTCTTASNVQQPRPTFIPPPDYNIPALSTSSPPGTSVISQSSSTISFEGSENMSVRITEVNVKQEIEDEDNSSIFHSDQLHERVTATFPHSSNATPSTSTTNRQQARFIPPDPITPALPISSLSKTSGPSQNSPKNKISSSDEDYAATLHELADSLKQLITISTMQHTRSIPTSPVDQVDSFLNFIGSFLRTLPDEELKLEVMSSITQKIFVMKKTVLQILK